MYAAGIHYSIFNIQYSIAERSEALMNIIKYPNRNTWEEIVERPHLDISQLNAVVDEVLRDVKENGDSAVKKYEQKFDHVNLPSIAVTQQEIDEAEALVSDELKQALHIAHDNIARFHESQKFEGKKIAYAVSFGCTDYPASALPLAKKLIHNFDIIGVRESSGIEIVKSLGRNDAVKVPDPTLLLSDNVYYKLSEKSDISITANYTYCFFIRNIKERIQQLNDLQLNSKLVWNNDDGNYLINDWLRKIRGARLVITDSFHCVVMCLKMHVPFVAVTEKKGKVAMNDRLFSLLTPLQLENYIIHKSCLSSIKENMAVNYRWESVDSQMVRLLCDADEFLSL